MSDIRNINEIPEIKINVYGIFGRFSLGKDNNSERQYEIKYFNTVASPYEPTYPDSGNTKELLKRLKPMREIVKAKNLKDLSGLLQRELNDYRIASQLIPYLQGKNSEIGFFPGILVALMPRGFLKKDNINYPIGIEQENTIGYEEFWSVSFISNNLGKKTALGTLSINPSNTDLIVLDGQHRANAFRFMTGTFESAIDEDSLYNIFYSDLTSSNDQNFDAQLPITIVWFESKIDDRKIDPAQISRKLFVDVNTTPQDVSESRKILLNDTSIPTIVTSELYSLLAEKGFSGGELSLLHSGFDVNDKLHAIALFTPSIINYGMQYFTVGRDHYDFDNLIGREANVQQRNYNRFRRFIKTDLNDEFMEQGLQGNREGLKYTKEICKQYFVKHLYTLLNSFVINRIFIEATNDLEKYIIENISSEVKQVWNKIFCGGEGLYSSIIEKSKENTNSKIEKYTVAINNIESTFYKLLSKKFGIKNDDRNTISKAALTTIKTKANYAGFFMALNEFIKGKSWSIEVVDEFISEVNKISSKSWITIFSELKPIVRKDLDPKSWKYLRGIYLRVIESNHFNSKDYITYQYSARFPEHSPDNNILENEINSQINNYIDGFKVSDSPPTVDEVEAKSRSIKRDAIKILQRTLVKCSLKEIYSEKELEGKSEEILNKNRKYIDLMSELQEE